MKRIVHTTLVAAAAGGLLAAGGIATAAPQSPASGGAVIRVAADESIQAAVDAAAPGDTIQLSRGVYTAAVFAGDKPLTIRGAGEHSTMVVPPEEVAATECWETAEEASAFCWLLPTGPVTVSDLTTKGHPGNGVIGVGMSGVTVERHTGLEHGEYGLAFFGSTGIRLTDNTEIGDGGEAGFYVGETADADALLKDNTSSGWLFGAFLRDARGGRVEDNTFTANCVGVTLLDTPDGPTEGPEPTEEPTATVEPSATVEPTQTPPPDGGEGGPGTNAVVGDWDVLSNNIVDNDRACPADGPAPDLSGHGVAIAGGTDILVSRNAITDHDSTASSALPQAGVTIASQALGFAPPRDIAVVLNTFARNELDVAWDEVGEDIVVSGPSCTTSVPASLCGAAAEATTPAPVTPEPTTPAPAEPVAAPAGNP